MFSVVLNANSALKMRIYIQNNNNNNNNNNPKRKMVDGRTRELKNNYISTRATFTIVLHSHTL